MNSYSWQRRCWNRDQPFFWSSTMSILQNFDGRGKELECIPRALDILEEKKSLNLQTNKKKPRYYSETLEKWRNALSVVAETSGFELNSFNCDKGPLLFKVLQRLLQKAIKTPLNMAKYPTALDEKVKHVETIVLLQQQSWKVNCRSWWSWKNVPC